MSDMVKSPRSGKEYEVDDAKTFFSDRSSSEGWHVTDAVTYSMGSEKLAIEMDTPFRYEGKPVTAYALVNMTNDFASDGTCDRKVPICELYQGGMLLDDVHAEKHGSDAPLYVDSPDGAISYDTALDHASLYSQSASFKEHVMACDEYKLAFNIRYKDAINKGVFEPASDDSYLHYLESRKSLMRDGMKFIGKATCPEQVDDMINTFKNDCSLRDKASQACMAVSSEKQAPSVCKSDFEFDSPSPSVSDDGVDL